MKKNEYIAPEAEVLEIAVEQGFAASAEDWREEEVTPEWDKE